MSNNIINHKKIIPITCPVVINNPLNDNEDVCRICYNSSGYLYQVCKCNGSIQYVHIDCLLTWLDRFSSHHQNYYKCEICNENYIFKNKIIEKK